MTPKDLARTDYVNEFIDLLEAHAPTTRSGKPAMVASVAGAFPFDGARGRQARDARRA